MENTTVDDRGARGLVPVLSPPLSFIRSPVECAYN